MKLSTFEKAQEIVKTIKDYETDLKNILNGQCISLSVNDGRYFVKHDKESDIYKFIVEWYENNIKELNDELICL